jgi:prepilin-type N-terminal cleavage/methylation domain-containing protein
LFLHSRYPGRAAHGFTLLELMVTMALAAMLLALGASTFVSMGRQTAYNAALSDIAGLVNRARNSSSRNPATLVVDPETGTVHAFTDEIVQELHFEPRPSSEPGQEPTWPMGVDGLDCQVVGGQLDPRGGRVGGGLRLSGGSVNCGTYAPYDVTEGLSVELWVKLEQRGRATLVEKGQVLTVQLDASAVREGGRLNVRLGVRDKGLTERVERVVDLPPVRLGEWLGVYVTYDRRELVVSTDEGYGRVVRDRWAEDRQLVVDADAPLVVGGQGLDGWVDDFRFGGIHTAEPLVLPNVVAFVPPRRTIRFVNGRLDPELHPAPAELRLVYEGRVTVIEIGQNGQVQDMRFADEDAKGVLPPPERKE